MKKRLLARLPGVKVFEVDGPAVRRRHVKFIEGGHGEVYNFVPRREIWVEKMRDPVDQNYILMHEMVEYFLMRDRGWDYNRAHDVANEIEQKLRRRDHRDGGRRGRRR